MAIAGSCINTFENKAEALLMGLVHCVTPTFYDTSQGFLGMVAATATLRAEGLKTWGLSMRDSIIET